MEAIQQLRTRYLILMFSIFFFSCGKNGGGFFNFSQNDNEDTFSFVPNDNNPMFKIAPDQSSKAIPQKNLEQNEEKPGPLGTAVEGFGKDTTGGNQADGTLLYVTSFKDEGPGTLRALLSASTRMPRVIRFVSSGMIDLKTPLAIPSNVTIDARGQDIIITDSGLVIDQKKNIILLNLTFKNIRNLGDALLITNGSHEIVVDHCLFDNLDVPAKDAGTSISVVFGSYNITVSWNRFENQEKVIMIGNGDAPAIVDRKITVTLHHNYFYKTGQYHPFLRYGKVDMYNNYLQEWRFYQGLQFCTLPGEKPTPCTSGVRSTFEGQILLEANSFEFHDKAIHLLGGHGAIVEKEGKIEAINNAADEKWIYLENNGKVFKRPYGASVEPINGPWISQVKKKAGNSFQ